MRKQAINLYKIDYEYGKADFYTNRNLDDALPRFYELASDCFGIRKSIGETKIISHKENAFCPEPWDEYKGAAEMLQHSGDTIIWNKKGKKIKSEWD